MAALPRCVCCPNNECLGLLPLVEHLTNLAGDYNHVWLRSQGWTEVASGASSRNLRRRIRDVCHLTDPQALFETYRISRLHWPVCILKQHSHHSSLLCRSQAEQADRDVCGTGSDASFYATEENLHADEMDTSTNSESQPRYLQTPIPSLTHVYQQIEQWLNDPVVVAGLDERYAGLVGDILMRQASTKDDSAMDAHAAVSLSDTHAITRRRQHSETSPVADEGSPVGRSIDPPIGSPLPKRKSLNVTPPLDESQTPCSIADKQARVDDTAFTVAVTPLVTAHATVSPVTAAPDSDSFDVSIAAALPMNNLAAPCVTAAKVKNQKFRKCDCKSEYCNLIRKWVNVVVKDDEPMDRELCAKLKVLDTYSDNRLFSVRKGKRQGWVFDAYSKALGVATPCNKHMFISRLHWSWNSWLRRLPKDKGPNDPLPFMKVEDMLETLESWGVDKQRLELSVLAADSHWKQPYEIVPTIAHTGQAQVGPQPRPNVTPITQVATDASKDTNVDKKNCGPPHGSKSLDRQSGPLDDSSVAPVSPIEASLAYLESNEDKALPNKEDLASENSNTANDTVPAVTASLPAPTTTATTGVVVVEPPTAIRTTTMVSPSQFVLLNQPRRSTKDVELNPIETATSLQKDPNETSFLKEPPSCSQSPRTIGESPVSLLEQAIARTEANADKDKVSTASTVQGQRREPQSNEATGSTQPLPRARKRPFESMAESQGTADAVKDDSVATEQESWSETCDSVEKDDFFTMAYDELVQTLQEENKTARTACDQTMANLHQACQELVATLNGMRQLDPSLPILTVDVVYTPMHDLYDPMAWPTLCVPTLSGMNAWTGVGHYADQMRQQTLELETKRGQLEEEWKNVQTALDRLESDCGALPTKSFNGTTQFHV